MSANDPEGFACWDGGRVADTSGAPLPAMVDAWLGLAGASALGRRPDKVAEGLGALDGMASEMLTRAEIERRLHPRAGRTERDILGLDCGSAQTQLRAAVARAWRVGSRYAEQYVAKGAGENHRAEMLKTFEHRVLGLINDLKRARRGIEELVADIAPLAAEDGFAMSSAIDVQLADMPIEDFLWSAVDWHDGAKSRAAEGGANPALTGAADAVLWPYAPWHCREFSVRRGLWRARTALMAGKANKGCAWAGIARRTLGRIEFRSTDEIRRIVDYLDPRRQHDAWQKLREEMQAAGDLVVTRPVGVDGDLWGYDRRPFDGTAPADLECVNAQIKAWSGEATRQRAATIAREVLSAAEADLDELRRAHAGQAEIELTKKYVDGLRSAFEPHRESFEQVLAIEALTKQERSWQLAEADNRASSAPMMLRPDLFLILRLAEVFAMLFGEKAPMHINDGRDGLWHRFLDAALRSCNWTPVASGTRHPQRPGKARFSGAENRALRTPNDMFTSDALKRVAESFPRREVNSRLLFLAGRDDDPAFDVTDRARRAEWRGLGLLSPAGRLNYSMLLSAGILAEVGIDERVPGRKRSTS